MSEDTHLLIQIKTVLEVMLLELQAQKKAPNFPRQCEAMGVGDPTGCVCHGFFNGDYYVDKHYPHVPQPVAVVETQDGKIQVVPTNWVTLK